MQQFNSWFGVAVTGPYTPGAEVNGHITLKNHDHLMMSIWIKMTEPEHLFSFRWHPNAIEPGADYSKERTTLVSFTLADVEGGTDVTIVESGFDAIPEARRAAAFSGNKEGWAAQLQNIRSFLAT